jgi:pullulanase-type alpha-1,6-glucosidase
MQRRIKEIQMDSIRNERGRTILSLLVALALLVAALPLPTAAGTSAAPLSGEAVRGDLNSWGSWAMTSSLGGTFIHTTGQITAGSDSSSLFKFFKNSDQWYGNSGAINFAQIYTNFSTGGGDSSFNHIQNRYYAFKWNGDSSGVVFQLSAAPVNIPTVNRLPVAPTSSDPVVVTTTTDATPPAEQALWLRYALNGNWGGSTVLKMAGSGMSYSATIPAQVNGMQVTYYVFSSGDVASIAGADADLMAITANTNSGSNYSYTVASAPGGIAPTQGRAMWLDVDTIAWNAASAASYRLLYDPDGGVTSAAEATACVFPTPAAPCYVPLTVSGTVSAGDGFWQNPNATGKIKLLTGLSADNAKHLLKGQVVVASYNGGGARVDATRTQIQSVLDALYAANAAPQTLGVVYSGGAPSVKLWAPTAKTVTLRRYADSSTASYTSHTMTLDPASGVWSVAGDSSWNRQFYLFDVEVYVPSTDAVEHNLVSDPYAVSLSQDGAAAGDVRSQFVNLVDADLKPAGWDSLSKPALAAPEDIVVYEMHVRDFSANDNTVAAGDRGTYKAFTYDGTGPHPNTALSNGMSHLKQLQQAGLTFVHLLPAFDIASVIEPAAQRTEPTVPVAARNSQDQQAAVGAARLTDSFNWGYDPFHYGLPEGSYSTNPDGATRILEFRDMVSALNQNGLRVVMDVVYNHTAASGQDDHSVLDKVVPGYYYRYDANGALYNSSCCSDTATEYTMMQKLMVDTVLRFAEEYKVDGFRFDLMNLHTRQNMLDLKAAVQALTVGANGVDGSKIYLYGEGWDFGSAMEKGLTACPNCYAQKYNMTGAGIGLFNDVIRDAAHGGYSGDSTQIRRQGFINGLSYDWNGYAYGSRNQPDLWVATDQLRSALRGSGTDWNGQGNPFTDDPQEAINYVEKHDNETLFDQNIFKLPNGDGSGNPGWIGSGIPTTSMADRVRSQNLGVSIVGLAQGIPFIQMGSDILRSKSLDRNSYDSGDWFNRVYWDKSSNNFGQGLPPSWDNSTRWGIMGPLLANSALDPTTANMNFAASHLRETLRLRMSSPLFRLTTEADVNARTSHYNNANSQDALIVLRLSDEPAPDLDPTLENILVFFNAHKVSQSFAIPGANGFTLHPLHTNGVDDDPVITGGASFNDATDTFTIPARTAVVFVTTQTLAPPTPPSTIDWVGKMWPRGGVANAVNQGAFVPAGFDIFVKVYDADVTDPAGAPAGISCYAYWGKYGQPWSDVPMTWNVQSGNDDEFKATIPQATLNGLTPGTYGFTAYCQRAGEDKKWKIDQYGINGAGDDDQGDGLITVIPTADSSPEPPAGVFVHLFEWRWADIQKECTFLAAKGYSAVQVSPPNEHLVPTANQGGQPAAQFPWWARYQPVSHTIGAFTSRSGTWAEFQSMVNACNTLGVDIYVDAVINHMADIEVGNPPAGTSGTQYQSTMPGRFYGSQYQADDFHSDCTIVDYGDRRQVQRCKLSGLPDLDTGKTDVQAEIRGYLQALINAGVKGFRIDGAKHMAAHDIAAILNGLTGSYYVFQEAIDISTSERVRDWEYTPSGDVTEFEYSVNAMGNKFNNCSGVLSDLQSFTTWTGMMPSRFAQVFVDNHDNQRGHGPGGTCIVDHRDGQVHRLANIFTLAYPYGHPSVMSSYYWSTNPASQNGDSLGPPTVNGGPGSSGATLAVYGNSQAAGDYPANCSGTYPATVTNGDLGKWVCEHRNTAIANMVKFRAVTDGQLVTHWQAIDGAPSNHIAFGRGDKGFVAINRTGSAAPTTYQTGMAPGSYCDITQYDYIPGTGECIDPVTTVRAPANAWIVVDASGQIVNRTLGAMDAFAIYKGGSPLAVTLASFEAQAQIDHVLVSWETVSELDNRGFNLYRGTDPAGPDQQLNAALIPSQSPGNPSGFLYTWQDAAELAAGETYYYWLEDLDLSGATTLHGPVSVLYQAPTAVTLNSVQAASAAAPVWPVWLALLLAAGLAGLVAWRRRVDQTMEHEGAP